MKVAVYRKYGPPDVVQIENVQKPVPKDKEVLLKVRPASVNPLSNVRRAVHHSHTARTRQTED